MHYLVHDFDPRLKLLGQIPCSNPKLIKYLNEKGFGVYHVVNEMKGPLRKLKNLKSITTFFVDIDDQPKEEIRRLMRLVLEPTRVVETGRGYHLYWEIDFDLIEAFKDACGDQEDACDYYSKIIKDRIIRFFKGDDRVKDAARILRSPGYYYWKRYDEGQKPFLVTEISNSGIKYSLEDILTQFPSKMSERDRQKMLGELLGEPLEETTYTIQDNIFTRANSLSADIFLERISGHAVVDGEIYTFNPNSSGKQLSVNGSSTAKWVDDAGKIGGGSYSNTNWVKWYLDKNHVPHDRQWKEIYKVLMELFPELK